MFHPQNLSKDELSCILDNIQRKYQKDIIVSDSGIAQMLQSQLSIIYYRTVPEYSRLEKPLKHKLSAIACMRLHYPIRFITINITDELWFRAEMSSKKPKQFIAEHLNLKLKKISKEFGFNIHIFGCFEWHPEEHYFHMHGVLVFEKEFFHVEENHLTLIKDHLKQAIGDDLSKPRSERPFYARGVDIREFKLYKHFENEHGVLGAMNYAFKECDKTRLDSDPSYMNQACNRLGKKLLEDIFRLYYLETEGIEDGEHYNESSSVFGILNRSNSGQSIEVPLPSDMTEDDNPYAIAKGHV